jgi:hypothetical protein
MPTLVTNISGVGKTLPPPFQVLLRPGDAVTLPESQAGVLAALGGAVAIQGTFQLTSLPDGVGSDQPSRFIGGRVDVAAFAQSGDGSQQNPWTGFDLVLDLTQDRHYVWRAGWFTVSLAGGVKAGRHSQHEGAGMALTNVQNVVGATGPLFSFVGIQNGSSDVTACLSKMQCYNVDRSRRSATRMLAGVAMVSCVNARVRGVRFTGWWAGAIRDASEQEYFEHCSFEGQSDFGLGTGSFSPPTGLSVSIVGGGGTTPRRYAVEAVDGAGNISRALGQYNGNVGRATLDGTHYEALTASGAPPGTVSYRWFLVSGGDTRRRGLLGTTSLPTFNDVGAPTDATQQPGWLPRGMWVVGADLYTPGNQPGFTNGVYTTSCEFNGGDFGGVVGHVVDDGFGDTHVYRDCSFNGAAFGVRVASCNLMSASGNRFELSNGKPYIIEYRDYQTQSQNGETFFAIGPDFASSGGNNVVTIVAGRGTYIGSDVTDTVTPQVAGASNSNFVSAIVPIGVAIPTADHPPIGLIVDTSGVRCYGRAIFNERQDTTVLSGNTRYDPVDAGVVYLSGVQAAGCVFLDLGRGEPGRRLVFVVPASSVGQLTFSHAQGGGNAPRSGAALINPQFASGDLVVPPSTAATVEYVYSGVDSAWHLANFVGNGVHG